MGMAAAIEAATGFFLLVLPHVVAKLLLGTDVSGVSIVIGLRHRVVVENPLPHAVGQRVQHSLAAVEAGVVFVVGVGAVAHPVDCVSADARQLADLCVGEAGTGQRAVGALPVDHCLLRPVR